MASYNKETKKVRRRGGPGWGGGEDENKLGARREYLLVLVENDVFLIFYNRPGRKRFNPQSNWDKRRCSWFSLHTNMGVNNKFLVWDGTINLSRMDLRKIESRVCKVENFIQK